MHASPHGPRRRVLMHSYVLETSREGFLRIPRPTQTRLRTAVRSVSRHRGSRRPRRDNPAGASPLSHHDQEECAGVQVCRRSHRALRVARRATGSTRRLAISPELRERASRRWRRCTATIRPGARGLHRVRAAPRPRRGDRALGASSFADGGARDRSDPAPAVAESISDGHRATILPGSGGQDACEPRD